MSDEHLSVLANELANFWANIAVDNRHFEDKHLLDESLKIVETVVKGQTSCQLVELVLPDLEYGVEVLTDKVAFQRSLLIGLHKPITESSHMSPDIPMGNAEGECLLPALDLALLNKMHYVIMHQALEGKGQKRIAR